MDYSVKKLAKLAGISVRTLHLYDEMGLLKPASRTEAGYRLYGEKELLRLQQILFYKELDMPLKSIKDALDNPDFDIPDALEQHRVTLLARIANMNTMLQTIDKTIQYIKGGIHMTHEELYEGLPREQAEALRNEAIENWGEENITRSETSLRQLGKAGIEKLKQEQQELTQALFKLMQREPEDPQVQALIARHYQLIRRFWGTENSEDKQAEAYAGLGELYVQDERYSMLDGKTHPDLALFMSRAMAYFSRTSL